jgi:hypothetical protein
MEASVSGGSGNDAYEIELDHAWLEFYGWEKPRPAEVNNLRVERQPDGSVSISFDPLAGAERSNLYVGSISSIRDDADGGALSDGRR